METVDFLTNVAIAAVIIMTLWMVVLSVAARVVNRRRQIAEQEEQDIIDQIVPLTVEVAGDQYLCYNYRTMDFVCQGVNLEEIRERFAKRFPDKNATIVDGDDAAITVLKQQFKQSLT